MNPFEAQARARKVAALVAVIDAASRKIPEATPTAMLTFVESLPAAEWEKIAQLADVRPPSATTIAVVIDVFRTRVGYEKKLEKVLR